MSPVEVKLWGPFACFTRPEFRVERVSYEVMTPSAARGALEAILWKPQFYWAIREIWVLNPIRTFSLVRNELQQGQKPLRKEPFFIDDEHIRTQRHTLGLRQVAYVVRADVVVRPGCGDAPAKYRDQFRRRVEQGRCFHRPSFGMREFTADFGPVTAADRPIQETRDLGRMLFDLKYDETAPPGQGVPPEPLFFPAHLKDGILPVPQEPYRRIRG